MLDKVFDSNKIIEKSLDATWIRNKAISQNIANVDTPGYKRKTVSFEDKLRLAMENSNFEKNDVDNIDITIIQDKKNLSVRLDGNNVNIDNEMAALAENTIRYNALVQCAGFSGLKHVLTNAK
ncbi:MAG: flagellar basal body rod protein FlgB [Mobilitalea sp.]